ncbi:MAG TPA: hypothetical protein VGO37_16665 [Steroidobacteraceae bacterium]|jgi:hypothetical protein|nr:hypothetical protein [Steroidobacteraceae bacterium]
MKSWQTMSPMRVTGLRTKKCRTKSTLEREGRRWRDGIPSDIFNVDGITGVPGGVTNKDRSSKALDDIAVSIKQLVNELESREKKGEILAAIEVRAIARQLQAHVANLLSEVRRLEATVD